ncbi:MAG: PAS domain-containing sensor histidine kinase [Gemmatimonadota bacterium]|nr:MAG: PAS domain-containing sensor histidine kinase [Gemmatimonadota bacterium]
MTRVHRSRIFWRIFSAYMAVAIVTTLIVGLQVGRRVERTATEQTRAGLHESAVMARELARGRPADLQERLRKIGAETATRYTVIDPDGTVRADSERDPTGMDNHADRDEIVEAGRAGEGSASRFSTTLGVQMMYVAISSDEGFVRAALPLRVLAEGRTATRATVALGVGLALVVAVGLGVAVTRSLAAPLVEMSETARSIAAGDYGRRIQVDRPDEVGALGRSFNLMAGEIQQRIERITEERDRFQTILGGMVEGVVAVDASERVLLVNDVAGRILGADPARSAGQPIRNVTRAEGIAEVLADALRARVDRSREIVLRIAGVDRVLDTHAGPFGGGEEPLGAVVVLHDVTELRRLESVRRDFVTNVSHELKTPLTAVRGILETVIDDPGMTEAVRRDFLGRMNAQVERLTRIVTDLLDLTRIESAPESLDRVPLDLREIVEETFRVLEAGARDRGVTLQRSVPEDPVTVVGDRASLRLLVDNLVDNAVHYTPAGGSVTLTLGREANEVRVEVRDTGIGIDPRHGDRIFERFYRADPARSHALGGTGLGLSIVRNVASEHGGRVRYESVPGTGTVFRVDLPAGAPGTDS